MPLSDPTIPLLFLYAETHFRFFRGFPSLPYRRSPEVLFDMPRRIAPGADLPIVLICNDIDKFPIEIKSVSIVVSQHGRTWKAWEGAPPSYLSHPRDRRMKVYLFTIPRHQLDDGPCHVNATVSTSDNRLILNDNFASASHKAFSTWLSNEHLPGTEDCLYGDLHTHSHYSESHVEFGAPVRVIAAMAKAYGIDFAAITDHSYDLECALDDFHRYDPTNERWSLLGQEIDSLEDHTVMLIRGEEVSVTNGNGSIVHLCALGLDSMLPGPGDGARRNSRQSRSLSILEALEEIHRQGGVAMAAHPGARSGLLQRLFLNRGRWQDSDVSDGLDAFQALNGAFNAEWYRSKKQWVRRLLQGQQIPLTAGNDAHGDFNRYRALTVPFVTIGEDFQRCFANCRTGIYGHPQTQDEVLEAIREGRTFVTNGPFLALSTTASAKDSIISHRPISRDVCELSVVIKSSYEFGRPAFLRVFQGNVATGRETPFMLKALKTEGYEEIVSMTVDPAAGPGYVRAELLCRTDDNRITEASTSPCYFE